LVASVKGGFGLFTFQGWQGNKIQAWNSDYETLRSFTAKAELNQELLEVSIMRCRPLEGHDGGLSGRRRVCRDHGCKVNLNYAPVMDHQTKFVEGMHYSSFDIHITQDILLSVKDIFPRLVTPFLDDMAKSKRVSLLEEDLPANPAILSSIRTMRQMITSGFGDKTLIDAYAVKIVLELFMLKAELSQRRGLTVHQQELAARLQEVEQMIKTELGAFKGVPYYASRVGMCETAFREAFKASNGITPHRLWVKERLEMVLRKLVFTDDKLADIALDLGFTDYRALSRMFKGAHHMSPKQFRQQNRQKFLNK